MKQTRRSLCLIIALILLCGTVHAEDQSWLCPTCGLENTENFCGKCGTQRPQETWICPDCGRENMFLFCTRCGKPRGQETSLEQTAPEKADGHVHLSNPSRMRSDPIMDLTADYFVLGSNILRRDVKRIVFLDSLDGVPDSAWDVSKNGDGSVMAWYSPNNVVDSAALRLLFAANTLYIAGRGGVAAPEDAGYLFAGYSSLQNIDFNGCFDTTGVTSMYSMFDGCLRLPALDLSGFDTSSVNNMNAMFEACSDIIALDLSGFDTGNVTDMEYMFYGCKSLITLDLSGFDTGNVVNMKHMFCLCQSLSTLDVSGFDTSGVTEMNNMFQQCFQLTELDLSTFDTSNVVSMPWMFEASSALTRIIIGEGFALNAKTGTDTNNMFLNCPARIEQNGKSMTPEAWLKSQTSSAPTAASGPTPAKTNPPTPKPTPRPVSSEDCDIPDVFDFLPDLYLGQENKRQRENDNNSRFCFYSYDYPDPDYDASDYLNSLAAFGFRMVKTKEDGFQGQKYYDYYYRYTGYKSVPNIYAGDRKKPVAEYNLYISIRRDYIGEGFHMAVRYPEELTYPGKKGPSLSPNPDTDENPVPSPRPSYRPEVDCIRCHGDKEITCTQCYGRKKLSDGTCQLCHGRGKITCTRCHGTGKEK